MSYRFLTIRRAFLDYFFTPSFNFYLTASVLCDLIVIQELLKPISIGLSPKQEEDAFDFSDHFLPAASGTEADSLAKRTQSIFIKASLIALFETVLAEFSITMIFLHHFSVVAEGISFSHTVSS